MAALSLKKLNGGSVLEVLVAMVIIMMVFGISLVIYTKIVGSSFGQSKLKAKNKLNDLAIKTKNEFRFHDEEIDAVDFMVHKKINIYKNDKGLLLLDMKAVDFNGKQLAEYKEIVLLDEK